MKRLFKKQCWFVCQNENGFLFLQTRDERENELGICLIGGAIIATTVVKTYSKRKKAEKYINNIEFSKRLINHCFR